MDKEAKIAAFEGGELHILETDSSSREVVLALPLSRLLVRLVRVPAEADATTVAEPILKSISPFPDEPLLVSCETVRESPEGRIVLAAALPEGSADDLAEVLDAAKLNVVRIDALVLGALRAVWSDLKTDDGGRRLVILRSPDGLSLIVLDGDEPSSIRAIPDDADLKRETWLSLLEAEDFNGPKELLETIDRTIPVETALAGIRERAASEGTLDATPESWREVLAEARFKTKLVRNLSLAGVLWALVMGVLLGVPLVYGFMTDHMKDLSKAHQREYRAVAEKKAKTQLVSKYSDHTRGALEIMKGVSDRLPQGVTLTEWRFERATGVTIRGEAEDKENVYALKDSLVAMDMKPADGEGEGVPVFQVVTLGTVHFQANRHKFEITCQYEEEEQ